MGCIRMRALHRGQRRLQSNCRAQGIGTLSRDSCIGRTYQTRSQRNLEDLVQSWRVFLFLFLFLLGLNT